MALVLNKKAAQSAKRAPSCVLDREKFIESIGSDEKWADKM
jgi:hypothetical protein